MTSKDQLPVASTEPPDEPGEPRSRVFVVMVAVVTMSLATLGLSQCGLVQQIKLDREVDRLCAIDGGVHIYETVILPKENFGPDGEVLVAGNPSLVRLQGDFVRKSDDKVMGKVVIYVRGGGDLPGPWHPSSHRCPSDPAPDLERQLFKPQEQ